MSSLKVIVGLHFLSSASDNLEKRDLTCNNLGEVFPDTGSRILSPICRFY